MSEQTGYGTLSIEKLKGHENYNSWYFAMKAYLESEDLWGCVEGHADYVGNQRKVAKARAKIILAIDKENYGYVQNATTAKEAWGRLKETFEDRGLTKKGY